MKRVLVTGWRYWPERQVVWNALGKQHQEHGEITVVHGKCPTGADLQAHEWCEAGWYGGAPGIDEDPHAADWDHCRPECYHAPRQKNGNNFCPAAGPYRNQKMVDLGADVCLAFPSPFWRDKRSGTRDCIERAERADIPVLIHDESGEVS